MLIRYSHSGVTLIELMIGIAILAVMILLAVPGFSAMIQNQQIRTQAESILNGLQLARAEAVKRNSVVNFQLVGDLTAACAPAVAGKAWVVSVFDTTGLCDVATDQETKVTDAGFDPTINPLILEKRTVEGSLNADVMVEDPGAAVIAFNGVGRVAPLAAVATVINVTNPTGGACAPAGPMRCLDVVVEPGGQIKMCDPALAATDTRSCF